MQFNIETCNTKIEELKKEKSSLIKEQEIELAEYKEFILYSKQPVISNNNKQTTQIQEQYKNDEYGIEFSISNQVAVSNKKEKKYVNIKTSLRYRQIYQF